jgi:hypothetical protein
MLNARSRSFDVRRTWLSLLFSATPTVEGADAHETPHGGVPPARLREIGSPVVSPDDMRSAIVRRVGNRGLLEVKSTRGGTERTLYSSNDACCGSLVWSSNRLLVFDDDYRARTVDVISGRVHWIAGFSNYAISNDGHWLAGWAYSPGLSPETIYIVSVTGAHCRAVPRPKTSDDSQVSFTSDGKRIRFLRRIFGGSAPGRWLTLRLATLPHATFSACLLGQS